MIILLLLKKVVRCKVNKVKKLTVNNNMFKNRVNAQPSNNIAFLPRSMRGVPGEAEDSWELAVTNNNLYLKVPTHHVNGHPSGGVIIASDSGSSEKGLRVFQMDQVVLLPFLILRLLLIIIVLKIWIVVLLLLLGINLTLSLLEQAMLMVGPARYVPTTGVTLGGEVTMVCL